MHVASAGYFLLYRMLLKAITSPIEPEPEYNIRLESEYRGPVAGSPTGLTGF